jgi:hypothetical protein
MADNTYVRISSQEPNFAVLSYVGHDPVKGKLHSLHLVCSDRSFKCIEEELGKTSLSVANTSSIFGAYINLASRR